MLYYIVIDLIYYIYVIMLKSIFLNSETFTLIELSKSAFENNNYEDLTC